MTVASRAVRLRNAPLYASYQVINIHLSFPKPNLLARAHLSTATAAPVLQTSQPRLGRRRGGKASIPSPGRRRRRSSTGTPSTGTPVTVTIAVAVDGAVAGQS